MNSFICDALPGRVVFGYVTRERLADEIKRFNCSRALILSTAHRQNAAYHSPGFTLGCQNKRSATWHFGPIDAARELAKRIFSSIYDADSMFYGMRSVHLKQNVKQFRHHG
jgi:hypothetical protein